MWQISRKTRSKLLAMVSFNSASLHLIGCDLLGYSILMKWVIYYECDIKID